MLPCTPLKKVQLGPKGVRPMPNQVEVKAKGKTITITNCTQCPNSRVERDPDPHDWFCDDDVKVRCLASKATYNARSPRCRNPFITVGCRPYNTEKECGIPNWCPLLKTGAKAT